jgi:hypothetical protein
MPTPGPPLREREGIMRRGREVVAWDPSPDFEADAEAEAEAEATVAEAPACSVLEEGPAAAGPSSAVVEFATMVIDDDDDDEAVAVVAAAAAAGRAVDADARLGIRLGDSDDKDFGRREEDR